jgi:6-phospho-beta-glucosidase
MAAVKAYERLTIDAALSGSRTAALAALRAHPLVPDADVAEPMLAELLTAHARYLPRFAT